MTLTLSGSALAQAKGKATERAVSGRERAEVEGHVEPRERERAKENARRALREETLEEKAARQARERMAADMSRTREEREKQERQKELGLRDGAPGKALLKPLKLKPLEPAPVRALRNQLGAATARRLEEAEANIALRSLEPYDIVATFRNRRVWQITTTRDVELFRIHSDTNDPASPWFLCCEQGSDQGRRLDGPASLAEPRARARPRVWVYPSSRPALPGQVALGVRARADCGAQKPRGIRCS
jgi:hypothetical protein